MISGILSTGYYLYPLFLTDNEGPTDSFDGVNYVIYFSLNLYQSMSIASRGVAMVVQLVCCVVSWLLVWGLLTLLTSIIKKRGQNM